MKIYTSIGELVGGTPLLELSGIEKKYGLDAKIYAKLEFFNPAGSVKDRVAREIIENAEREGKLTPESAIIEPTSGNTGIGIAAICASKGYRAIIVMPDNMSKERQKLISAFGAELVLTDGKEGMAGAIKKAEELKAQIKGSFILGQFTNPQNADAHRKTTGPEIWSDTDGLVDIFVAGVGTGGTLTGVGEYLKSKNPSVKVVAVEPYSSPILSGGNAGAHKLQGIGAGFIPDVLNTEVYDEIITVKDEDAMNAAREVARLDGALVGISSGAALYASLELAKREENKNKRIVVLLPDTGERYLSTELFS